MNKVSMYTMVRIAGFVLLVSLLVPTAVAQQGHVLNGVGPIDQGMSGAGMAAPQDALTALHWNPASVFAVPGQSLGISLQMMMPTGSLQSTVQAGAFGFAPDGKTPFPWMNLDGTTDSEAGPFPIPSIAYSRVLEGSRLAFGVSAFGVGGFGVDYALSPSNIAGGSLPENPLLSAQQMNGGMGFGALKSTFMLLQVAPSIAYRVSDRVSVGIAPTLNMASLELSVMPATAPATGVYPDAPATWAMGYGVQAGLHATLDKINIGLSVKSPQIFQDFEYSPETTPGSPDYTFRMDVPMILSGAVAYTGTEKLLVAADVRYLDYGNTEGFKESGFDPATGAVLGFGWKSIVSVAFGAQYEVAPGLPVRIGYSYNDNPIEDDATFFNTPAPAIIQQHVSGGFSYKVSDKVLVSLAAQVGLENDISGNWKTIGPGGLTVSVPNTSAKSTLSTLTVIGGVQIAL